MQTSLIYAAPVQHTKTIAKSEHAPHGCCAKQTSAKHEEEKEGHCSACVSSTPVSDGGLSIELPNSPAIHQHFSATVLQASFPEATVGFSEGDGPPGLPKSTTVFLC